jgi:hypothetical protein
MRVRQEHVVHPSESFRFRRFETVRFNVPFHRHRQLELTLIERGAGLRFVADHVAPFEAPDLVLIGSDVPHCPSFGGCGRSPHGRNAGCGSPGHVAPRRFGSSSE